ncbi:MAG: ABC transporter permease [Tannerellaceae bacterium]|jgi:ABC-2 type transport system permease protein|nr:ABC transporter permease [Tannerellaceae bacterium]
MNQFLSFVRKEFCHIFRDVRTMLILLLMPIILVILFGYAISTEIRRSPVAVLDHRRDDVSFKRIEQFRGSEYFTLHTTTGNPAEIHDLFRKGEIKIALIFPADGEEAAILSDATNPNEATALTQYATAILASPLPGAGPFYPTLMQRGGGVKAEVSLLYNPQMKGSYNFVPGVMGLILILICAMMTSVGVVRERETGSMEVLLVSPLRPAYIILAKAAPYLLISIVNIATILLLSRFLLDVPIRGSVALLIAFSILYALVALCLGLFISTIADTQQAAMLISGVALMLPVVLLSGMIFPVENMPWILQRLSDVVPAKWYIAGVKDVMIKGLGYESILRETGILALMAIVLTAISIKRFNTRL